MRAGARLKLADLPGTWSVWSQINDGPGAHAVVPADDEARATGLTFAVVRVKQARTKAHPDISLVRVQKRGGGSAVNRILCRLLRWLIQDPTSACRWDRP